MSTVYVDMAGVEATELSSGEALRALQSAAASAAARAQTLRQKRAALEPTLTNAVSNFKSAMATATRWNALAGQAIARRDEAKKAVLESTATVLRATRAYKAAKEAENAAKTSEAKAAEEAAAATEPAPVESARMHTSDHWTREEDEALLNATRTVRQHASDRPAWLRIAHSTGLERRGQEACRGRHMRLFGKKRGGVVNVSRMLSNAAAMHVAAMAGSSAAHALAPPPVDPLPPKKRARALDWSPIIEDVD